MKDEEQGGGGGGVVEVGGSGRRMRVGRIGGEGKGEERGGE